MARSDVRRFLAGSFLLLTIVWVPILSAVIAISQERASLSVPEFWNRMFSGVISGWCALVVQGVFWQAQRSEALAAAKDSIRQTREMIADLLLVMEQSAANKGDFTLLTKAGDLQQIAQGRLTAFADLVSKHPFLATAMKDQRAWAEQALTVLRRGEAVVSEDWIEDLRKAS